MAIQLNKVSYFRFSARRILHECNLLSANKLSLVNLTILIYPLENGAIMDIWRNIGRSDLAPLLGDPRYPAKPYTSNKMPGLVSPANIGDNYGLRFKTFYVVSSQKLRIGTTKYMVKVMARFTAVVLWKLKSIKEIRGIHDFTFS